MSVAPGFNMCRLPKFHAYIRQSFLRARVPIISITVAPWIMFTNAESTFLKTFLPAFCAHHTNLLGKAEGQRKVKRIKGRQSEWVLQEVFPLFVKQFCADSPSGPKLDDLRKVNISYSQHFEN